MPTSNSALDIRLCRVEGRLAAIEELMFRLSPSQTTEHLDTVEAVKVFLRKIDIPSISPHVALFLRDRLPADWRELFTRHGATKTLSLLASDRTIIEARRLLA